MLLARPEAHGVIWAYLAAEVQGPLDHDPLQWLSRANEVCGFSYFPAQNSGTQFLKIR